jgi:DNA repair protein RecO (recombination protein O)
MHAQAIVLRRLPLREHDQLVVLYTHQQGKLAAVAKSSLKRTSRQAPSLDEGTLLECELVNGRASTLIIAGAQGVRGWSAAKESPLAWAVAQHFLETVDALVYDAQPDERLWNVLMGVFLRLDEGIHPLVVLREGQTDFLDVLGYGRPPHGALDDRLRSLSPRPLLSLSLIAHLAERHIS